MEFSKTLRGYSPREVELYLDTLKKKYNAVLSEQRQRIDELSDENAELRKASQDYKEKEQSIVDSLVASQKVAESVRSDAEKYAEVTLLRAKRFYVAWQSYAQTLVNSLSDSEVKQFNEILAKIEQLIDDFDGESVREFAKTAATKYNDSQQSEEHTNVSISVAASDVSSNAETDLRGKMQNPIKKVEESAGVSKHIIELEELLVPTESLDELCQSLGVKKNK